MQKDIKQYLHLYLGCDMLNAYGQIHKLTIDNFETLSVWGKPILRPLSSMTLEEKALAYSTQSIPGKPFYAIESEAHRTAYLLSKHFDLFGLIESGLAIDATTLTPQNL